MAAVALYSVAWVEMEEEAQQFAVHHQPPAVVAAVVAAPVHHSPVGTSEPGHLPQLDDDEGCLSEVVRVCL